MPAVNSLSTFTVTNTLSVGIPVYTNADPSGVTGLAKVSKPAYPDHFAWKKGHKYFNEKGTKASPVWCMVDIAFIERFDDTVPLATLKATKGLGKMVVTQKGSRLSVQPATKTEYDIVTRLGRKTKKAAG